MSKPSSRGKPLRVPAEPDHDLAQRAVVDVEHPLPGDAADVDVELVAVVHVVVDQGGEQVVRGGDRREVAGEVQVDVGHRHDLAVAAAGRAALHAEHRAHRRLAQAGDRPVPQPVQRVGEPDRGRGLALAGRGRATSRSPGPAGRAAGRRARPGSSGRPWPCSGRRAPGAAPRSRASRAATVADRAQRGGVGDLDVRQHSGRPSLVSSSAHASNCSTLRRWSERRSRLSRRVARSRAGRPERARGCSSCTADRA